MKKTIFTAPAAALLFLLSGCGSHVSTTTGPNGTTLNRVTVWSGTTVTLNPQTGDLCIDAAKSGTCKENEVQGQ